MADYLKVEYSAAERPYTDYPRQLCNHLFEELSLRSGMKLLEAGCGRGEFLRHFKNLGLDVCGIDRSPEAMRYQPDILIHTSDIEKDGIPFPDASFDVVYSKSLLEHFTVPERYIKEAARVLKPGGMLLTLVPDWESCFKIYYDDYTHRTPFSFATLESIYRIADLEKIRVFKFRQLPIVWKYPVLNYVCSAISPFIPVRTKIPFFRWSRELMLVGVGMKPLLRNENIGPRITR
jgi:SAM-dependent methyltransferase